MQSLKAVLARVRQIGERIEAAGTSSAGQLIAILHRGRAEARLPEGERRALWAARRDARGPLEAKLAEGLVAGRKRA